MLGRLRAHLTYANVMSTLAVFLILAGGGAYAALKLKPNSVKTKSIKNSAVTSAKIADSAVTGPKIANGAVGPAAVSSSLHLACRAGTTYLQGACIDTSSVGSAIWYNAVGSCRATGGRLPSTAELLTLVNRGVTNSDAEWTDTLSANGPDEFAETVNVDSTALVSLGFIANPHTYRCAFDPTG
jgi:hypothetical protein